MRGILSVFAEYIYTNHRKNFTNCCVIFPNKRAGFYFLHYLQSIVKESIITPHICSITEFYELYTNYAIPDKLTLLVKLYQSYKKINKSDESFENFYPWGEIILNDFNDVDKQLVNAKELFQNITSIKEIDRKFNYLEKELKEYILQFWSTLDTDKFSAEQQEFIQIWQTLNQLYWDFKISLKKDNWAYEGMICREVVENIKKDNFNWKFDKFFIIGLNALTKCDEEIFKKLLQGNKVEFFWDYDKYYAENYHHQGGTFIRSNLKNFPETKLKISKNRYSETSKKVNFYSCSGNILQVKSLAEIIKNKKQNDDDTVVVLADENLLIPLLNNPIPGKQYNVSIGFSLRFSPLYSWIVLLSNLHTNLKKFNTKIVFHKNDVLSILQHPYCEIFDNTINPKILLKKQYKNHIFQHDLVVNSFTKIIFQEVSNLKQIAELLTTTFNLIFKQITKHKEDESWKKNNREFLFHINKIVQNLYQTLVIHKLKISPKEFYNILKFKIKTTHIPFAETLIDDIQVMGLLETRLLDYKHVSILSANEEYLPKKNKKSSFIPYHLRKGFNLPTKENQDNIISYYFYRLLQNAEEINLFYVNNSSNSNLSEPSRFIQQLKYENSFEIRENIITQVSNIIERKKIEIEKNKGIQNKIKKLLKNGISPSALNCYLDCGLKFYFQYIEKIKEPKDLAVSDNLILGDWFHNSARKLYEPILGTFVKEKDINKLHADRHIKKIVDESFKETIAKFHDQSHNIHGKYLLLAEIVETYIKDLLKYDKQFTPFRILSLEEKTIKSFELKDKKNNIVNLKGFIDRVDIINDKIRIIDYKTGLASNKFQNLTSLFDTNDSKRNKAALQILIYCLFYENKFEDSYKITPYVFQLSSLNSMKEKSMLFESENKNEIEFSNAFKNEFMSHLRKLIIKISSNEQNFFQTENEKLCKHCIYAIICRKD